MKTGVPLCFLLCILLLQSCSEKRDFNAGNSGNELSTFQSDTAEIGTALRFAPKHRDLADSMIQLLNRADSLSRKHQLDSATCAVLFWKGIYYYDRNNYNWALELFAETSELARKNKFTALLAKSLERQASIHLGTDDPYLALKLYYESLSLCEKISDSSGIARVYNIIGYYKGQSGEFDTGVYYLNKAIIINQNLHDRRNKIENLGNLGYVYRSNGKKEEAEKIYQSLVSELIEIHDSTSLPVIYYNMAAFRQDEQKNDSARMYLRKAMEIAEVKGDTSLLSTLYGNTGEIFLNEGEIDSARYFLNRCLEYSKVTDDVETQLQSLSFLLKIDTLTGRHKDAFSHFNLSLILQDSISQRKLRNNKEASELQYENEKKKATIENQQQALHDGSRIRNLIYILLALSIAVLILIAGVFLQQKKNLNRKRDLLESQLLLNNLQLEKLQNEEDLSRLRLEKMEQELRHRESELVSIALGIEQKNELIELISKRIKETMKSGVESDILTEIISSIRMQMTETSDNDLFNQRFSSLHKDFFNNLQNAHPELTKTEVKFCAYLRIQLSGSQIANIMNVTNEAIRKTRYRIRKKMSLPVEASLEAYIMKF
ncbi:MAG: tetratricopeptide repeat protein [Bacteroidales bacterium]|nr:tetratricopeptide repeat protein [Bacteroidales bacterium]